MVTTRNPWWEGDLYARNWLSENPNLLFPDPIRDDRLAILMDIEPVRQSTVWLMSEAAADDTVSIAAFWVDEAGVLQMTNDLNNEANPFNTRWQFQGGSPPPAFLIMRDNAGATKYLSTTFDEPPVLTVSDTIPPGRTLDEGLPVGEYIEFLGYDGQSIYRLTVAGTNHAVFPNRVEPERMQGLRIQHGHPWAYDGGRTYVAAIIEMGDVESNLSENEFGFGGIVTPRIGIIKITFHDTEFDFLTQQDWDGREFTIRVGSTGDDISSYSAALRGTIASVSWTDRTLSFRIRDTGELFNRSLQPNLYGGTGGYEGESEIEGQVKPILLGTQFALTPVLLNDSLWLYQIHDGAIMFNGEVTQGGLAMTYLGDFPDTLLTWQPTAAEVAAGAYRSDNARGMFRLAGPPAGRIVCQRAIGDVSVIGGGQSTVADLCLWVLDNRAPEIDLVISSFNQHRTFYPFPAGAYIDEPMTLREFFRLRMRGTGSALGIDRLGDVYIRTLQASSPIYALTENDIERDSLRRDPAPLPGARYRGGYLRAHTVLTDSDLFQPENQAPGRITKTEWRYAIQGPYGSATTLKTTSAKTKTMLTDFAVEPHAQYVLSRVGFREFLFPHVFTMTVRGLSWRFKIGDIVTFEYPRWGMDVPHAGVIVGVLERSPTGQSGASTRLKIWI